MIICSNCGATNSEADGRLCRKCGALLPIPSNIPRIRLSIDNSAGITENGKSKPNVALSPNINQSANSSNKFPSPINLSLGRPAGQFEHLKVSNPQLREENFSQPNQEQVQSENFANLQSIPQPSKPKRGMTINQRKEFLQEITPQPFHGSLIVNKGVFGHPTNPKQEQMPQNKLSPIPAVPDNPNMRSIPRAKALPKANPIIMENQDVEIRYQPHINENSFPQQPVPQYQYGQNQNQPLQNYGTISHSEIDPAIIKQKQLKDDMASVVASLSKKLKIPEEDKNKLKTDKSEIKKIEESVPPSSMNEILKKLIMIDKYIEASAIIKSNDGTILASAISNRISDGLFATIGQNLSLIGNDIIESLMAGKLKSISVRGTEGVLDLAPIDKNSPMIKDMILIIFSHPRVKSGVINIAANLVKKEIKEYLGIKS
ncbi:MAG: hypothetical protein ACTSQJ_04875 [Promethearchaeota archaeon]